MREPPYSFAESKDREELGHFPRQSPKETLEGKKELGAARQA